MSGAKRDFFRFCEEQDKREQQEKRELTNKQQQKGQPSPVDDGNLKGNENGLHRN